MRSVEEHRRIVADLITARPARSLRLADAEGLVLAEDVVAPLSLPMFDNSAMDGYAVLDSDIPAGTDLKNPVKLPVAQDIPAGRTDLLTLTPGTAHRIMTGAPLPQGATAVVPVELTDAGMDLVEIRRTAQPGQHIRRAGEDVTAGTTVLRAGQVVSPAVVGLAAALGLSELTVIPRLRVLVMSTGTELIKPGAELLPGQIYESNAAMLAAAVREAGAEVVATPTSNDEVDTFRAALEPHLNATDLIITSGGVSAGAYEVVKDAFGDAGDGNAGDSRAADRDAAEEGVEFAKVAMQPGMPQGAGRVRGVPIVTLPGNPVSSLVSFEVFVRPALRAAMAVAHPDRPRRTAVLTDDLTSPGGKRQFRRGVYSPGIRGETGTVTTYGPPASHHLRWLASANCLLEIDEDTTELTAGQHVQVWDLRAGEK